MLPFTFSQESKLQDVEIILETGIGPADVRTRIQCLLFSHRTQIVHCYNRT